MLVWNYHFALYLESLDFYFNNLLWSLICLNIDILQNYEFMMSNNEQTSILPIRPKTFDSSYQELRLSKLTYVNLYVLLVLVACRQYLQMVEKLAEGIVGFGELVRW